MRKLNQNFRRGGGGICLKRPLCNLSCLGISLKHIVQSSHVITNGIIHMTMAKFFNRGTKSLLAITSLILILIPSTPSYSQTLKNQCPAGKFCPAGTISPVDCPAGHYCPTGSTEPRECSGGQYCPSTNMAAAGSCTAGYFCSGTVRILCPVGYYCPFGAGSLMACPVGSISALGQVECQSLAVKVGVAVVPEFCNGPEKSGVLTPGWYRINLFGGDGADGKFTPTSGIGSTFGGKGSKLFHYFYVAADTNYWIRSLGTAHLSLNAPSNYNFASCRGGGGGGGGTAGGGGSCGGGGAGSCGLSGAGGGGSTVGQNPNPSQFINYSGGLFGYGSAKGGDTPIVGCNGGALGGVISNVPGLPSIGGALTPPSKGGNGTQCIYSGQGGVGGKGQSLNMCSGGGGGGGGGGLPICGNIRGGNGGTDCRLGGMTDGQTAQYAYYNNAIINPNSPTNPNRLTERGLSSCASLYKLD